METEATLYTQEAQLREQTKALAQLEQQLKDFAEAYKLIKTERNHTHSQIHKLQQVLLLHCVIVLDSAYGVAVAGM